MGIAYNQLIIKQIIYKSKKFILIQKQQYKKQSKIYLDKQQVIKIIYKNLIIKKQSNKQTNKQSNNKQQIQNLSNQYIHIKQTNIIIINNKHDRIAYHFLINNFIQLIVQDISKLTQTINYSLISQKLLKFNQYSYLFLFLRPAQINQLIYQLIKLNKIAQYNDLPKDNCKRNQKLFILPQTCRSDLMTQEIFCYKYFKPYLLFVLNVQLIFLQKNNEQKQIQKILTYELK
ncbi:hypothetical protein TTHERM_000624529 (macronuclear) [Tetrahymena thermophila SB210]|uniref:Uncharacterized protein n=1 Tax=Tetrahymena thermophila (strain SB210) TaxID=312017 RepID=W7XHR1_TETTS|nr:hypothetical protein TTHERM_000624529 [Tetrahymena thermophila SB210]EWS72699.1 hypothetical protein TTHERM_000624529 [Tetrahymena thermophila SB210]|eukprot:XP_012654775.1 hypothetical protein TTHERM_000624529 [Tetrahymena thermophila SB210]